MVLIHKTLYTETEGFKLPIAEADPNLPKDILNGIWYQASLGTAVITLFHILSNVLT